MKDAQEIIRYDEEGLIKQLNRLNHAGRVTFAATCAQRLIPAYAAFHEKTGKGDLAYLNETLERIWKALFNGAVLSESEITDRAERCEKLVPIEDDDWIEQTAYAQNAAAAIAYTVRCQKNGNSQEAAWAARQIYEAVDFYVINRRSIDTEQPDVESIILRDPLIQAELKRQKRDLSDLSATQQNQVLKIIDQLRIRSLREGSELFG